MDNFYTSMAPFCFISQIIGFFPLSFDGPARKGFFKTKIVNVFMVIVSQGTIIIFACQAIDIGIKGSNDNLLRARVWSWILICGLLMTLLHFLLQMTNLKKIVKFYHGIHRLDLKLYAINAQVDHKKSKNFVIAALISMIILPLYEFTTSLVSAHY